MSLIPGKIVLKSSTSKTLSDRFGEIAKTPHSQVENIRTSQRQQNYASQKNRRLAAHMAQRLSTPEETPTPRKKTVKSRLGIPITNRLGNKRGGQVRGRGRGFPGRTRGQRSMSDTRESGNSPSRFQVGNRGRRGTRGQTRGQTRGRGGLTNRGGRGRGGRGRGGTNQFTQRGRSGVGGRGRGRGRGASDKPVTQQQLDSELDKYMSKTKSVLNAQLDQYMKAAGGE